MNYINRALEHRKEQADTVRKPGKDQLKGWPFPLTREKMHEMKEHCEAVQYCSHNDVEEK